MENRYEKLRDYAWKYFQYHASQRLTTFHFYILISSLISTGYFFAVKYIPILAVVLGIFLIVLSFVFCKLDRRNKQMIKNSEDALKYIENKDEIGDDESRPHILNIFCYEENQTNELQNRKTFWPWKKTLTYSKCFDIIFWGFSIFGVLAIIFSFLIMFS